MKIFKLSKKNIFTHFNLPNNHSNNSNISNRIVDDYLIRNLESKTKMKINISNLYLLKLLNLDTSLKQELLTVNNNSYLNCYMWKKITNENQLKNILIEDLKDNNVKDDGIKKRISIYIDLMQYFKQNNSTTYNILLNALVDKIQEIILIDLRGFNKELNDLDQEILNRFISFSNDSEKDIVKSKEYIVNTFKYVIYLICRFNNEKVNIFISNYDKFTNSLENTDEKKMDMSFYDNFIEDLLNNSNISNIYLSGEKLLENFNVLQQNYEGKIDVLYNNVSKDINFNANQLSLTNNKLLEEIKLNIISMLTSKSDKLYVDLIKCLVKVKDSILKNDNELDISNENSTLIKSSHYSINNFFTLLSDYNFLNFDGNKLTFNKFGSEIFLELVFKNLRNLPYKHQLALFVYSYLHKNKINEFLNHLQQLFKQISQNASEKKDFEKFPNFIFRTEVDLDNYLIDILTLDLNCITSKSKDLINIYQVEDDSISLSEPIKSFTFISYDHLNIGIFIKGLKLKKNDINNIQEFDENNFLDMVKTPVEKNGITKSLDKIIVTKLNSISTNEAINFAKKANENIKSLYIVCVSNYLKQIQYGVCDISSSLLTEKLNANMLI